MESSANRPICLNLLMDIEDIGILTPLAQRWLDEIQEEEFSRLGTERPITNSIRTIVLERACGSPATCGPNLSDDQSTTDSNGSSFASSSTSTEASSKADGAHPPLLSSENIAELAITSNEKHSNPELHTQQTKKSLGQTTSQALRSEFRPQVETPSAKQSVYQKLINSLGRRDLIPGSVYIFERSSSQGFVKIGWTAGLVSDCLERWSECGHQPDLLFSSETTYAQRVETLIHYELIKEWRMERKCMNPECSTRHQEWFEVDKKKAEQLLRDWIYFINEAQPYDLDGELKTDWVRVIDHIKSQTGGITASELVKYYNSTLTNVLGEEKGSVGLSKPMTTESDTRDLERLTTLKPQKERPESNLPIRIRLGCGIKSLNRKIPTLAIPITEKELAPEEIPLPLSPIINPARL
ncbi:hypothetical protein N7541_001211 [Penicillium brevicompactum]|uniref:Bacteriophage T5 Orf172 DNA-binding domain-containing protein n=1 Tax=Penicillium brevicompactum TaxID=5074 RepID=A0A9W9V5K6_PENBR|nr:hypothetical protein N7541_001211 [Penicillium brevicompactum]